MLRFKCSVVLLRRVLDPQHAFGAIGIAPYGSAAKLNIHLHGLDVYRTGGEGAPVFHVPPAPSNQQLQALLDKKESRFY